MNAFDIQKIVMPVIEMLKETDDKKAASNFLREMGQCNSLEQIQELVNKYTK